MKTTITALSLFVLVSACASHNGVHKDAPIASQDATSTYLSQVRSRLGQKADTLAAAQKKELKKKGQWPKTGTQSEISFSVEPSGKINDVRVLKSGGKDWDRLAVKATQLSSPLGAPPKEMLNQGPIEIRWAFVSE